MPNYIKEKSYLTGLVVAKLMEDDDYCNYIIGGH